MLRRAGIEARLSSSAEEVEAAGKLILPGVGHFDYCMTRLKLAPFWPVLQRRVLTDKVPLLGLCVGCQMLMDSSEEGGSDGLGWIKGKVVRFDTSRITRGGKIPHVGWTDTDPKDAKTGLYQGMESPRFYYVHSYHLDEVEEGCVTATANYGYDFPASVAKENIMGVQYHPEKSHRFGLALLTNFHKNY
jgi:glutamine amidotransferase